LQSIFCCFSLSEEMARFKQSVLQRDTHRTWKTKGVAVVERELTVISQVAGHRIGEKALGARAE
jgi:hypothetical protein